MKLRHCDVIVIRRWHAEHVAKGGYWFSWYLENVIGGGALDVESMTRRIRAYWRGDCVDAVLIPDVEAATDVALTYNGPWAETVRAMAARIALGEDPRGDGGQHAIIDVPRAPSAPSGSGITLDSLVRQ